MANENIHSAALSEGIAFMEKCLDTMLSEQRKAAHNAIDMDDWSKTEEIIAKTKKNIVGIEDLKAKFAEFKAEAVKLELISGNAPAAQPKSEPAKPEPTQTVSAEQPKPAADAKPAEQPKPAPKPVEPPKPSAEAKPAEQPKPTSKSVEPPKQTAEAKPAEQPTPAPKPVEQPKPTAEAKPAEQPKPAPKPVEPPKPMANAKPAEQPKPAPKPAERPQSSPRSEANNNILDMEMSDFEPAPKPKNPIVNACEELITKFPFSMRLIYSNPKIGKFFTSDNVIAENDMSKPQQLTNGLWVETDIPEERVQAFIRGILRYCEESVNM